VGNEAPGRLYVVATPIGNLGDLSPRAREILASCQLIAAEDTRHSGALLKHFGINTPLLSLHDHNEAARTPEILSRLHAGAAVALVSDAGTPAISDPGFELVRAVANAGIEVIAVPGPCALVAALSIGALPTDRFCFEGFLPAKSAARRARLQVLLTESRTMVFYESPHRLEEMLKDCVLVFGAERPACIVRELTKLHETSYRGSLREIAEKSRVDSDMSRGEIVLLIGGHITSEPVDEQQASLDRVLKVLLKQLPLKQAAELAAQITGARDNEAYRRALAIKGESASH
jgi:16S rRNA (cytidine1402-2'-O)-methyltransferase